MSLVWSAHISWLFTEMPYLQRVGAARRAGFERIETGWPREVGDRDGLLASVVEHGLGVALLNCNEGDVAEGERGFLNDATRREQIEQDFLAAAELAQQLGARSLNLLVGRALADVPLARQRRHVLAALRELSVEAKARGLRILLEPLNLIENPDYLLASPQAVAEVIERCEPDAVGMLLDVYHVARSGGDPLAEIERYGPLIGHVQISDFPGRGAPGTGSLALGRMLKALEAGGYEGSVGLEYVAEASGEDPIGFLPDAGSPVRLG
ncbi:MAG: TIM barrel protein [Solirubrobacterales bacterium]|nr:TIM barrel protein [Solirubrobacterales bacterium]